MTTARAPRAPPIDQGHKRRPARYRRPACPRRAVCSPRWYRPPNLSRRGGQPGAYPSCRRDRQALGRSTRMAAFRRSRFRVKVQPSNARATDSRVTLRSDVDGTLANATFRALLSVVGRFIPEAKPNHTESKAGGRLPPRAARLHSRHFSTYGPNHPAVCANTRAEPRSAPGFVDKSVQAALSAPLNTMVIRQC